MDVSKIGGHNLYLTNGKITGKTPNAIERETVLQANQNGNERGIEINISREGRERQLSGHSKLTVDNSILDDRNITELKAAINGESSWDSFVEFTDPSLEVPRGKGLLILQSDSPQERYRKELINAASLYDSADTELDAAGKFSSAASKYMELRKGIAEKYSGDELVEQLKMLDESYDNAVNMLAEQSTFGIKSSAKIFEMAVKVNNDLVKHRQTHGHTFGISVKDTVSYDKEAFENSVKSLVQNVQNSIKSFGALAKQYMLDGNDPADKNAFEAYILQNTDESKGLYSLSDIDTLNTIFDPIGGKDSKSTRYDALAKLENSNISDSLKAAVVRMTTQSDRMFGTVPGAYKDLEKSLYESMQKWEKTPQ